MPSRANKIIYVRDALPLTPTFQMCYIVMSSDVKITCRVILKKKKITKKHELCYI